MFILRVVCLHALIQGFHSLSEAFFLSLVRFIVSLTLNFNERERYYLNYRV